MTLAVLMPGAEPFFYAGSATGCLLVHGFTSSPGEMRWLGQYLAEAGFTVLGVRLAGHGTQPEAMVRLRWQDWFASLLDGYYLLRDCCEQVYVIGHSMGGLLTLMAAATVPVEGIAVMAAPLKFQSRWVALASLLKYVRPYIDATDHSPLPGILREEQKRRGEPVRGRVRYDRWSVSALAELHALAKVTTAQLGQIAVPTCLIYSTADKTASIDNRRLIEAQIHSKVVETHMLNTSDHNLMVDVEREIVFRQIEDFVRRQCDRTGR